MTQHEVRSANFGPTWPEVAGFGEGTPQQAVLRFYRKGESSKRAGVYTPVLLAG
ncbi:hypothetical protein SAMN02745215_00278 [Desulfitobacterium chlororespirans DSM 11544]|uniref:Uncharacterized protein n=1 Tax=Desulfitobacterium chlororespirans DSM 11544 TaxID=1121395 RepID=A0A1M7RYV1_9FIRM|nr:hypothetical protein SAMN02745215_00278 [Desulfitobacterium chlororespirans DSM 11544]